ncbi:ATP-binding domain-containing protein [Streptomyces phytohabitans]|uniref:ATP-binding domain-containing protein n=1 Tax=Streptomyces phytohabitans TaxID=1150371 RepID=UPI00387ECDCA
MERAVTSQDKAAELLAAVRAVESGERAAASFFAEPARPAAPARPRAADRTGGEGRTVPAAAGGGAAAGGRAEPAGPLAVPEDVRALLAGSGAPEELGGAVVAALGPRADAVLRDDPWQLLAVPGVLPEQADGFARAVLGAGCGPDDERRTCALTVWLLERAALRGHTAREPEELRADLARHGVPDPEEALRGAVDAGAVLVFEDALDALEAPGVPRRESGGAGGPGGAEEDTDGAERPVRLLAGLDRCALAEESLADGLARLIGTFGTSGATDGAGGADVDGADGTDGWAALAAAAPSPSAAELVRAAAGHGLVAHTGGEAARAEPAALVAAAASLGLRAYAVTHGEDGRRRAAELVAAATTAYPARTAGTDGPDGPEEANDPAHGGSSGPGAVLTVAGLLDGGAGPGRDEEGMYALDLLVVLDAPQLDAETAAALVESVPDGARLVLSGDPLLLGSAGPGQVFRDVLAARACPRVVSRTPDPGPVGELVSGVGVGELLQVEAPGKEVVIVPVRDAGDAVHRTVQLVADSVPRALGVPTEDTQVVTPAHGGSAGTRALNAALKERLNPGPGRFGGFDPGDRVAHSAAPGRTAVGTVVSADQDGLRLDLAGDAVVVPPDRVPSTVRHGWAVTAHQAAGLRWPAVVAVLPGDAADTLTREWVYTAFSRADRHLSVVHGVGDALPRAVAGATAPERTTRLRTLLVQAAQAATAPAPSAAGDPAV